MKKRAFTLIELMGVIIILGVIALIAIPTLDRQLKEGKENLSENQKETIEIATKLWVEDNKEKLPESGEGCYIKYDELINAGYLEEELKDITTGETINNDKVVIKVTKDATYDKYTYTIEYKEIDYDDTEICRYINVPYVKKGLVTLYDGINNTGNGHNGNSTIWKDLVGDKDIDISSGSTNVTGTAPSWSQGNGLKFGNTYDSEYGYLTLDYSIDFTQSDGYTIYSTYWNDQDDGHSPNLTACDNYVWAFTDNGNYYSTSNSREKINLLAGGRTYTFINLHTDHNFSNGSSYVSESNIRQAINREFKFSWAMVLKKNSSDSSKVDITIYRFGHGDTSNNTYSASVITTTTTTSSFTITDGLISKLYLGGGTGTNATCRYYNVYLYNFMVYNRALESSEIQTNFNADEQRYSVSTQMYRSGDTTGLYIP